MKKIHYIFSFILLLMFCIVLVSCPIICTPPQPYFGRMIAEYPDWCATYDHNGIKGSDSFGYSEWIDWQSDKGRLLHAFVEDVNMRENFNGKYRLALSGQELNICFNDPNSSFVELFIYLGDYTDFRKDGLVNIDTNSDTVEYDCWIRKLNSSNGSLSDECLPSNKSKVQMTKVDDKSFSFVLDVDGKRVIDVILKNQSNKSERAIIEKKYSWLPTGDFTEVIGTDIAKNDYYGKRRIDFDFDSTDNSVVLIYWLYSLYCFEGISLRSVDEANKKISFWLEDRNESDFADYLEIHITKEDWTDEPKRGATKNNKRLMKGTLGFYKEGDPNPVRFYDEAHSEFTRLVD